MRVSRVSRSRIWVAISVRAWSRVFMVSASVLVKPLTLCFGCLSSRLIMQFQGCNVMRQSRRMSLAEAAANVVIGYGIAVATQVVVFPVFGIHITLADDLRIGLVFAVVSILRSYALRRLFEVCRR
ncbi:hypothetical protein amb1162 [Paramagnetospirillum magneticum AMB-1]|uniref:Uncharacterized protein n=2 Tax=Paramagnetospirillum magneticum TaxID=84159 RepID=Q2W859_PARM1|nr:hypothetical protein amb1162 [Paramagnetospirillum magneticum AMB-1]